MSRRDSGPPGNDEGRPTPETAHTLNKQHDNKIHLSADPRQCRGNTVGRYADAWQEGFRRGAIDALRLTARRVDDPWVWLVLSELTKWYEDRDNWGLAR